MGRRPKDKIESTARLHDNNHVVLRIDGESTKFLMEILSVCRELWAETGYSQLIQGNIRIEFDKRYPPLAGYRKKIARHIKEIGVNFTGAIEWVCIDNEKIIRTKADFELHILNKGYGHGKIDPPGSAESEFEGLAEDEMPAG